MIINDTQGWQRRGFAPIPFRPAKYPMFFLSNNKKTPFPGANFKKIAVRFGSASARIGLR
jgi:hypothetical protein